ncbi:hypothetical protein RHGRI_012427 [Rhododendron griersonianum]|uniref:F-box associated beta-propeller type 3 domain-containing protein n=1 Tax=Rhododendron griersonianum TaxID=479676 RepID=A0AAV6KQB8_9ERIC|nr:hypothetical protein RHGRI_012427 [Rhododendron griersonianum]
MYRKFSQPEYARGEFRVYGLGYDSVSDDFKVVRIVMPESNDPCDVHMFTSKLSSWKQIGDIDYSLYQEGNGAVIKFRREPFAGDSTVGFSQGLEEYTGVILRRKEKNPTGVNFTEDELKPITSVYSVDYQAPDRNVAELELEVPCKCKSKVEIMGSCNGVILLGIGNELCLWNPSIRMYRKFSQPKDPRGTGWYGLGYDSVSDDFKVVSVVIHSSKAPGDVYVFTSKHSSWKWIGDTHYIYKSYQKGDGTVVNGMPHWLWIRSSDGSFMDSSEYGVKESWTKLFVVPSDLSHYFKPLCYAKDEKVVMMLGWDELVIYDPKEIRYTCIGIPQDGELLDMALYVESLVSPHGGNNTAN